MLKPTFKLLAKLKKLWMEQDHERNKYHGKENPKNKKKLRKIKWENSRITLLVLCESTTFLESNLK